MTICPFRNARTVPVVSDTATAIALSCFVIEAAATCRAPRPLGSVTPFTSDAM